MTTYDLQLPAVVLDGVVGVAAAADLLAVNRIPGPGETGVPLASSVLVTVLAIDPGATVTLADTVITVGGVTAYDGGTGFQNGFTGAVTVAAANRVDYEVVPPAPFASLAVVPVTLDATADAGGPLSASWSFTAEDVTTPVVVGAVARALRTVRVSFDEPLRMLGDGATADALTPANYVLSDGPTRPVWLPFYTPLAVSVVAVSATAVDVSFDAELSPAVPYRVTVGPAEDLAGNPVTPPSNVADFLSVAPPVPAGRSFVLYDFIPAMNRREDAEGTGDLKRFVYSLQEVVTLLLGEMDAFLDAIDPDYAPEAFVDAMLADLGNPFRFDLTLAKKRLLLSELVTLYRQKGTARGILAAVLFFLGLTVNITDYTSNTLTLGVSVLGVDWQLGPGGSWALYAFDVHCPVSLDDETRTQLIALVEYMKPAHTHFARLIEPTAVVVVQHWQLGKSKLGTESILH